MLILLSCSCWYIERSNKLMLFLVECVVSFKLSTNGGPESSILCCSILVSSVDGV